MKVTMKVLSASPSGVLHEGRTYDLPYDRAQRLVRARSAVPAADDPAAQTAEQRAERATKRATKRTPRKAKAQPVSGEQAEGTKGLGE